MSVNGTLHLWDLGACDSCFVELQAKFRSQEAKLLRSLLTAHAQGLTENENISEKVCSLAKDLLQLLTQEAMGGSSQGFEQPEGHYC